MALGRFIASLISILVLIIVGFLPVEGAQSGFFWRCWYFFKVPCAFIALVIPLVGLGHFPLRILGFFIPETSHTHADGNPLFDFWVQVVAGICCAGFGVMLIGQIIGVTSLTAWFPLALGYMSYVTLMGPSVLHPARRLFVKGFTESRITRGVSALVIFMLVIISLSFYRFHEHGDSYLYHLALSDNWITKGKTGVILSNIYSGYALAIEHFYLLLRLITNGVAEQNALAKFFHFYFGYGLAICSVLVIFRKWLSPKWGMAFVLIALQSEFVFHASLPKNDAFMVGVCLAALASYVVGSPANFILMGMVAFSIKLTAAFWFGSLGLTILVFDMVRKEKLQNDLMLLSAAAAAMVAFWYVGFGYWNQAITKNPLFPFLGEVFHSPFGRDLQKVVYEMQPLKMTPTLFLTSVARFFLTEPLMVIGGGLGIAVILYQMACKAKRRVSRKDPTFTLILGQCLVAFVVLQLAMGVYSSGAFVRHYLAIHLLLTCTAFLALVHLITFWPKVQHGLLAFLLIWGVSRSHAEVKAYKFYQSLRHADFIDQLRHMKPRFAIVQDFEKLMRGRHHGELRLLDTTENPQRMLVGQVEVYHPMNAYPIFKWADEKLPAQYWSRRLAEEGMCYVLTSKSYKGPWIPRFKTGPVIIEQGPYQISTNPKCKGH